MRLALGVLLTSRCAGTDRWTQTVARMQSRGVPMRLAVGGLLTSRCLETERSTQTVARCILVLKKH